MAEPQADQPYVDPHHKVPDDQWARVVKDAQAFRAHSEESETE